MCHWQTSIHISAESCQVLHALSLYGNVSQWYSCANTTQSILCPTYNIMATYLSIQLICDKIGNFLTLKLIIILCTHKKNKKVNSYSNSKFKMFCFFFLNFKCNAQNYLLLVSLFVNPIFIMLNPSIQYNLKMKKS